MSAVTTHILDLTTGRPAAGVAVALERKTHSAGWQAVGQGLTNTDGRVNDLVPPGEAFMSGHYRLNFEIGSYFLLRNIQCFFPQISISFVVKDSAQHFHVPLLLSPFGYSTYRGS
ncbi:MAG TPA: hydroxyisourate hydrolase [Pyrinomonadaceae bacterium]|jgi:5-hydroxyisourate hydrolase|nr:hydroxyisourate hydrolase [Pyrinomonadaceae bacterium]